MTATIAAPPIVGGSPAMTALRATVARVAGSDVSVLVTGPSGAGKEVVARAIHAGGPRGAGPFVALNCAAIPRDLLESELFGHQRGAFTGAVEARAGRFETAGGGTLFLDEIGDMPLDMQAKLLRVIEERRVERVGGGGAKAIDVRLIAATHRDLQAAIEAGTFREDLYFRLAVFPIALTPLAQRPEDIAELADHFARALGGGVPAVRFSPGALALMSRAAWRGNARELRNFVERAALQVERGGIVDADGARECLALPRRDGFARTVASGVEIEPPDLRAAPCDLDAVLGGLERVYITAALRSTGGVVAEAARLLTIRRTTLLDRMRKHGIRAERTPRTAAPTRRAVANGVYPAA